MGVLILDERESAARRECSQLSMFSIFWSSMFRSSISRRDAPSQRMSERFDGAVIRRERRQNVTICNDWCWPSLITYFLITYNVLFCQIKFIFQPLNVSNTLLR